MLALTVEGGICCGIVKTALEASIGRGTVEVAQLVTEGILAAGGREMRDRRD